MKDEPLLILRDEVKKLESKDVSHVAGFMTAAALFLSLYDEDGSPIQKCLLEYMMTDLKSIHTTKTDNSKFKHITK